MSYDELEQIRYIKKEIERLEEKLVTLPIIKVCKYDNIRVSGGIFTDRVAEVAELSIQYKDMLLFNKQYYLRMVVKAENFINSIEDSEIRLIARLRFIDAYRWEDIGYRINYDGSWARKKLKRFLKKPKKPKEM